MNENQHWVPKFLIRNFTDEDGRVFCLDIHTDTVTKPPPKYAAAAQGFNDFVVNGTTVSYEDALEKIETAAAPVLRRIIATCSTGGLTDEQRTRVADFMAAQSFRTRAFYEGLDQTISRQDFGSVFAELWRGAFLVSAEIARRRWVVMTITHDDIFYLGDHPLVLQFTEEPGRGGELGFDVHGVEAFLPLTPTCALYMPCVSISRQVIGGYESALAAPEIIRYAKANGIDTPAEDAAYIALAQRVQKNSAALYQALAQGTPLVALPENVINLNSLQCNFAHGAIYANRRDFTFAREVFRKTPTYRDLVKVRLARLGEAASI
ncbi:MAG: DUF4238 domain-containing protein [Hyphomicrobiales bacterium]